MMHDLRYLQMIEMSSLIQCVTGARSGRCAAANMHCMLPQLVSG